MITDPLQLPAIKAYADRIGAEKLSLRSITVRENSNGYWKYSATIRFMPDGTIKVQADNIANFKPTEREAEDIKEAVLAAKWPKMDSLAKLPTMPPGTEDAEAENLFFFKTQDGKRTIMVQHRVENDQSIKRFIPWTHWGDAGWQKMEPEGSPDRTAARPRSRTEARAYPGRDTGLPPRAACRALCPARPAMRGPAQ